MWKKFLSIEHKSRKNRRKMESVSKSEPAKVKAKERKLSHI